MERFTNCTRCGTPLYGDREPLAGICGYARGRGWFVVGGVGGGSEERSCARALQDSDTAQALNVAPGRSLAGIYAHVSDGMLHAEFDIAAELFPDRRSAMHLFQHVGPADPTGLRTTRIMLGDGPVKPGPSPFSTSSHFLS